MDLTLWIYCLGAFITSVVTQYLVIDLSHKNGIFIDDHTLDLPQKLHNTPTPRIGGLGIFVGCLFMVRDLEIGLYIILCTIPAFLAGFLEDLFAKISPWRRLFIMSISAIMAVYLLQAVVTDFSFMKVPYMLGVVITMIAVLGLINGTNMIDGFNGLSAGVCCIIFTTYFFVSLKVGDVKMAYVSVVIVATILGFLLFNFPHGKIFLGDGGAYLLGFMLAVLSILIVKRNPEKISPWFSMVCLIYPVWEVIFSFTRRTVVHKLSPLYPDSKHFHQLLYRNVTRENNPRTTLLIYPIVIVFNALGYFFCDYSSVLFFITLFFITMYTLLYFYFSRKELKQKNISVNVNGR